MPVGHFWVDGCIVRQSIHRITSTKARLWRLNSFYNRALSSCTAVHDDFFQMALLACIPSLSSGLQDLYFEVQGCFRSRILVQDPVRNPKPYM